MPQSVEQGSIPPEVFVRQVKQALESLYDFAYLQRHPLARQWASPAEGRQSPGERLQQELQAAIEVLSPGANVPPAAPHARLHSLLALHYVKRLTAAEAANLLGISRRQAHRDLRRAEESVAAVLWARLQPLQPQETNDELVSVAAEVARLEPEVQPVDLRDLLWRAQAAVGRLAERRGIHFEAQIPSEPVTVSTDPAMARQILVNTLSYAVQHARPGTIELALAAGRDGTLLSLRYRPEPAAARVPALDGVAAELATRLGWQVTQATGPGRRHTVALRLIACPPTVLVIDDNEGLATLLDRYLTGHACRVVAARTGQEALHLAREAAPDAILLDVMMPGMDGWEVLQRLRTRPQTSQVPVIICSVFNDPELADSLGASSFLAKPIRREDVLSTLRQLGVL